MYQPRRFEPAELNDRVALKTGWGPCKRGGASFRTRALQERTADRVRFRPTIGMLFFASVFTLAGLGALSGVVDLAFRKRPEWGPALFLSLFVVMFAGVGFWMLFDAVLRMPTFDKQLGLFFFGAPGPSEVDLSAVHALQIVSEYCGGKSSFFSYELNLVLKDGKRVNVADHGNLAALRADAASLATFLGVPLWDPVSNHS